MAEFKFFGSNEKLHDRPHACIVKVYINGLIRMSSRAAQSLELDNKPNVKIALIKFTSHGETVFLFCADPNGYSVLPRNKYGTAAIKSKQAASAILEHFNKGVPEPKPLVLMLQLNLREELCKVEIDSKTYVGLRIESASNNNN